MKESSFFINFPPVLSLHVSERKEEKERKVKLSRDVLPAPLNADVDLFVLLRNLHLRPGWPLHVYLKSHLTEKDTAITLEWKFTGVTGSAPKPFLWSLLPSQKCHFHINGILMTKAQEFSSGYFHPLLVPCLKKTIYVCDGNDSISGWQASQFPYKYPVFS